MAVSFFAWKILLTANKAKDGNVISLFHHFGNDFSQRKFIGLAPLANLCDFTRSKDTGSIIKITSKLTSN